MGLFSINLIQCKPIRVCLLPCPHGRFYHTVTPCMKQPVNHIEHIHDTSTSRLLARIASHTIIHIVIDLNKHQPSTTAGNLPNIKQSIFIDSSLELFFREPPR